jgi:hypothetical protein
MGRITSWWRCLSQDTLLKLAMACCNVVATLFIGFVELYYSPDVRLLQSSPTYPMWLKWFARALIFMASIFSVIIAVRGALEDGRKCKLAQASTYDIGKVINKKVDEDTEIGGGTA